MYDVNKIRREFPILERHIKGKPLVYLDNAATTQKPRSVIEALSNYYRTMNANVHRGIHTLSEESTMAYEATREDVAKFIKVRSFREIVFTRNTTEAINLVANSWGKFHINKGDEIIVSALEHHSNLVPWQELAHQKEAVLKVIPLIEDLSLDYEFFSEMLSKKTKLVALTAMSNVLGTRPQIKEIITLAHKVGARVMIDAAQAVAHLELDVQDLNADFLAFSAHKMLGPTGVGVLYSKEEILEKMPPFLYGGDMVHVVNQYQATYNDLPWRFEAGTPNFADVIAFREALKFLKKIGMETILSHDQSLVRMAAELFGKYERVKIYLPPSDEMGSVLSFTIEGVHPHDIAQIFNEEGVAIRSGTHCAQPLIEEWMKVSATARLSFYLYNNEEDVERAEKALQTVLRIFK